MLCFMFYGKSVLSRLETLKKEATEVNAKMCETDQVMAEIERVSRSYTSLASACSSIYFSMQSLAQLSFLYQYSLQFFFDMFAWTLFDNEALKASSEPNQRLSIITTSLFRVVYARVTRGMLNADRLSFAMLLVHTYVKCGFAHDTLLSQFDAQLQHLLNPEDSTNASGSDAGQLDERDDLNQKQVTSIQPESVFFVFSI